MSGIGISSLNREDDIHNYIHLLNRTNFTDVNNLTDFELLDRLPSYVRIFADSLPTRMSLINYVLSFQAIDNYDIYGKSTDEYQECLSKARKRYQKGTLKLCPEGYCTAKSKFEVYPSAYANAYASQVCNGSKPDLEGNQKNYYGSKAKPVDSELTRWFKEEWVNVCESGNPPCGRKSATLKAKDYPYCRPKNKLPGTTVKTLEEMNKEEIEKMCKKKRSIEPGVEGKPTRVYVKN